MASTTTWDRGGRSIPLRGGRCTIRKSAWDGGTQTGIGPRGAPPWAGTASGPRRGVPCRRTPGTGEGGGGQADRTRGNVDRLHVHVPRPLPRRDERCVERPRPPRGRAPRRIYELGRVPRRAPRAHRVRVLPGGELRVPWFAEVPQGRRRRRRGRGRGRGGGSNAPLAGSCPARSGGRTAIRPRGRACIHSGRTSRSRTSGAYAG